MCLVVHNFSSSELESWVYKPYRHWLHNIAEDWMPTGFNSKWFHDWLYDTHGLEWAYIMREGLIVVKGKQEDWMRFLLEWG